MNPERVAFPAAYILLPLLTLLYPVVWAVNAIANFFLRIIGVSVHGGRTDKVTSEELRAVVMEAGALMPESHQDMLLAILDLEKITVEDVMVPRREIEGVDLDQDWNDIMSQLATSHYTRLPLYRGSLDNIVGIVHLRKVLHLMRNDNFSREELMKILVEPYYVPEGTALSTQLLNFRAVKRRVALVVNEYGDIVGLVTLEEILEEIVGDFTSPAPGALDDIQTQEDGSHLINGSATIRELNRRLGWNLPTDGPKTLNGLITEYLEDLPESGTSLMLEGYPVEILRTRGTAVQTARIWPKPEATAEERKE
jgi:Mg2+/Co2+ transporter CorB